MIYVEVYKDSRGYSASESEITQEFVYVLTLEEADLDAVENDPFFGPDQDIYVQKWAFANFPIFRSVAINAQEEALAYRVKFDIEEFNDNSWKIKLKYEIKFGGQNFSPGSPPPELYCIFNFTTQGQNVRVTESLEMFSSVAAASPAGIPAPEKTGRAINIQNGVIEGTETKERGLSFSLTSFYDPLALTFAFLNTVYVLTQTTNNATFYGFAAGELLLEEVHGEVAYSEATQLTPITFQFTAKPNIVNQADVHGPVTFPPLTCTGHTLLDYRYRAREDAATGSVGQFPVWRFLHRMYNPGDFSALAIGCV